MIHLPIIVEPEDNWFIVDCPLLPWCHTEWNNIEDLSNNLEDAINVYMDWIKSWFISSDTMNKYVFFINLDQNGKIQNNIMKGLIEAFDKKVSIN